MNACHLLRPSRTLALRVLSILAVATGAGPLALAAHDAAPELTRTDPVVVLDKKTVSALDVLLVLHRGERAVNSVASRIEEVSGDPVPPREMP